MECIALETGTIWPEFFSVLTIVLQNQNKQILKAEAHVNMNCCACFCVWQNPFYRITDIVNHPKNAECIKIAYSMSVYESGRSNVFAFFSTTAYALDCISRFLLISLYFRLCTVSVLDRFSNKKHPMNPVPRALQLFRVFVSWF